MFIPMTVILFIGTYVWCFKDEFDQENMKSVWAVVGVVALLLVLGAIFAST